MHLLNEKYVKRTIISLSASVIIVSVTLELVFLCGDEMSHHIMMVSIDRVVK